MVLSEALAEKCQLVEQLQGQIAVLRAEAENERVGESGVIPENVARELEELRSSVQALPVAFGHEFAAMRTTIEELPLLITTELQALSEQILELEQEHQRTIEALLERAEKRREAAAPALPDGALEAQWTEVEGLVVQHDPRAGLAQFQAQAALDTLRRLKVAVSSDAFVDPYTLTDCPQDADAVKHPQQIRALDASQITPEDLPAFVAALSCCTGLRRLSCKRNWPWEEPTWTLPLGAPLARAIAAALPRLSCLQVLHVREQSIGDEGAEVLASALWSATRLTELRLDDNGIGRVGMDALADALPRCAQLRTLDLSYNSLDSGSAKLLAEVLPGLRCLQELKLGDNEIEAAGAEALAAALPHCHELKVLDLGYCVLHDRGTAALAAALPAMDSLQQLDISHVGTGGSSDTRRALMEAVRKCSNLRVLKLEEGEEGCEGAFEGLTAIGPGSDDDSSSDEQRESGASSSTEYTRAEGGSVKVVLRPQSERLEGLPVAPVYVPPRDTNSSSSSNSSSSAAVSGGTVDLGGPKSDIGGPTSYEAAYADAEDEQFYEQTVYVRRSPRNSAAEVAKKRLLPQMIWRGKNLVSQLAQAASWRAI